MEKLNVSLVQLCSGPVVDENLSNVEALLHKELVKPPDIILLPECFASFGDTVLEAESQNTKLRAWMSRLAEHYQCWLIGGTIPYIPLRETKSRASCFVYDPLGREISRYDKIHLFDVDISDSKGCYRESDDYQAGADPVVVNLNGQEPACLGLSVCYDLRFPELYRKLVDFGANILCVPSAFTYTTGKAHWEVLLRARAIENQSFVLAANQVGSHYDGRKTWGHSMIVSPWGEILSQAESSPCVISSTIDLACIKNVRSNMPCLQHKKL